MKILYASYRHDPTNPDLGSSIDYECYQAFLKLGHLVALVGPLNKPEWFIERVESKLKQVYKRLTNKSGMKFPLTTALRASMRLRKAVKKTNPDIVFSLFPPFFVFFQSSVPSVWFFDTTFIGQEADWPLYGKLALELTLWEEAKAFNHVSKIITMSEWSKKIIIGHYKVEERRIEIIPAAATIPPEIVPNALVRDKQISLEKPVNLLLVGRVYHRKGADIAIEVAKILERFGLHVRLKICGLSDPPTSAPSNIEFVGPFKKSDQEQLQSYINLYQ